MERNFGEEKERQLKKYWDTKHFADEFFKFAFHGRVGKNGSCLCP